MIENTLGPIASPEVPSADVSVIIEKVMIKFTSGSAFSGVLRENVWKAVVRLKSERDHIAPT